MFTYQEVSIMNRNHPEVIVQLRMRIIQDPESGKRIRQIAKEYKASGNTIRRIWRRYQEEGREGRYDRPRRPKHMPRKTPKEVGGVRNIALKEPHLRTDSHRRGYETPGVHLDGTPHADKKSLRKERCEHRKRKGLPLYPWTALVEDCRLRFLAFSYRGTQDEGRLFMALTVAWLRTLGVQKPIVIQTDHGTEFGWKGEKKVRGPWEIRDLGVVGATMYGIPWGRKRGMDVWNAVTVRMMRRLIAGGFSSLRMWTRF